MADTDTNAFEAEVSAEGYDVFTKSMPAGETIGDHTHDFDVQLLVTAGEIAITVDGETTTCRAGNRFALEAHRVHSEAVGPEGVSYIVGRRGA
jgi:quercetin dioxygenase-like cupin family protein